ncbi:unnamed protein product [Mytilus coruscus]|uniref:Uncharacterized protein n=1 Tax=Mytilus coruscus TaxID=42192 RepID=A0A6J8A566_MYTCO|nr:unnamed protein product [Mytilus coruscus]
MIENDTSSDYQCKVCIKEQDTIREYIPPDNTNLAIALLDEEITNVNRGDEYDACSPCDIVNDQQNLQYKNESLSDSNDRYIRLETYIKRLESEKDYENTIRTLKRKMFNMEDTHSYPKTNNNVQDRGKSTNDPENAELLDNIHKKVTSYILRQVDMQFQNNDHVHHEQNEIKNRINQHEQFDKINPMTTSSCTIDENNTTISDSNKLENK